MDKKKIVGVLNHILEMELAGVVRYTHYSLMVFGHARIPIVSWLRGEASKSMAHAATSPCARPAAATSTTAASPAASSCLGRTDTQHCSEMPRRVDGRPRPRPRPSREMP